MADINYAEDNLAAGRFKITNPEKIPAARYYDEAFFKLECEQLWGHAWQMACRLEQIPNVGDWIDYQILGKSVIVVRTAEGIKAFHNHCRHRGVPLTEGTHGNCKGKGFICPFHGWRWNMDGDCTFVYGRHMYSPELLEKDELSLRPCRVETWGGCAFINFDDDAPSYHDCIGPVAFRLEAHGMNNLRSEWWYATVLPANWKIAMEAFMEGYHVMKTHPQLQKTVPMLYNTRYGNDTGGSGPAIDPNMSAHDNILAQFEHLKLLNCGMAGMVTAKELEIAGDLLDAKLPENPAEAVPKWYYMVQEQITKRLRAAGMDVPDLNAVCVSDPVNAVEFLFPNYFLLPFFTGMSSYRIRPLGPESCLFEIWSLIPCVPDEEPNVPMEPVVLPYDSQDFPMIPRQDYSNIPLQQKGMHSKGLDYLRLAKNVEGLISNYQRLIDGYIDGRPLEQLARANHALGGNFDGKIIDFEF